MYSFKEFKSFTSKLIVPFFPIIVVPQSKKDLTIFTNWVSLSNMVILNLKAILTWNLALLSFIFIIENDPSASVNPVIKSGSIFKYDLLYSKGLYSNFNSLLRIICFFLYIKKETQFSKS